MTVIVLPVSGFGVLRGCWRAKICLFAGPWEDSYAIHLLWKAHSLSGHRFWRITGHGPGRANIIGDRDSYNHYQHDPVGRRFGIPAGYGAPWSPMEPNGTLWSVMEP